MTQNNRETMQRAIGIIEGAFYSVGGRVQDALITAIEMFDSILNSEEKNHED